MQVWTTIRQQKEERNSVQQEPMTNRDVVVAVSFVTAFCETRVASPRSRPSVSTKMGCMREHPYWEHARLRAIESESCCATSSRGFSVCVLVSDCGAPPYNENLKSASVLWNHNML